MLEEVGDSVHKPLLLAISDSPNSENVYPYASVRGASCHRCESGIVIHIHDELPVQRPIETKPVDPQGV